MVEQIHSKALILGAGPAGYTAAIYTARAGLEPHLVTGMETGGQMSITTDVENYPGFAEVIQGPWLMEQMHSQAVNVGTHMHTDLIVDVTLGGRPFRCTGDGGTVYTADALIIATGAQARWLGLDSEAKFQGFGVSACATCDGFFYRDRKVAVVGGGNTAVEEALYLTNHASHVTLIHRRDELRAEKILQQRLFANDKISCVWDSVVEEVLGTGDPPGVTGIRLRNMKSNATDEMEIDGLFVAIGHDPATKLFTGQIDMDDEGYIITAPDSTATSIPGVFAAGDVQDNKFRQAVTAAGTGCMAALEVEHFLAAQMAENQAASAAE